MSANKQSVLTWLVENEELNNRLMDVQLNEQHSNSKITVSEISNIMKTLGYEQSKVKYTADDICEEINN